MGVQQFFTSAAAGPAWGDTEVSGLPSGRRGFAGSWWQQGVACDTSADHAHQDCSEHS